MNQSSLLFWEGRTCQNPCAAAGVILWAIEPNQPEKSAVSLPGSLASLSASHFCLERNILLCQPSAENCCCCSILLVRQPQKTLSEHCVFFCSGGSLVCSCSHVLGLPPKRKCVLEMGVVAEICSSKLWLLKSVLPFKSIRKAWKLTCVRGATTFQVRSDYAHFWRKLTYHSYGPQLRGELVSYFEHSTDVSRRLTKMHY